MAKPHKPIRDKHYAVSGAGLGLRRDLLNDLEAAPPAQVDFMEVAPENWIHVGGALGKRFRAFTERYPFVTHGLSLSLGGPAPLDEGLVGDIKQFLDTHRIRAYSEHLSYCSDDGHLYDLMPIPFTEEAVGYVAGRIRRVQEILERRIAIENVSYYAAPGAQMDEATFINAVLEAADCDLLLDVNNIYVNSVNHRYDPLAFMKSVPGERIAYCHVAGHYREDVDLIVDTHGADVIDPVWKLLDEAYAHFGVFPTMLERDFNFPPLPELLGEVETIRAYQRKWQTHAPAAAHG
ncbi:MAG: HvfB family MNIO-type RiPP peptide maturase [Gammaproteobacteria bacterium]